MRLRTPTALLALLALAAAPALAQVCEGDVTLTSQAQVDAFDCAEVIGYLRVQDSTATPITSLGGLSALESVGGFFSVGNNDALTSLDGLGALASVGGFLQFAGNGALTSLDGIDGLTSVGGDLNVVNNDALTSLNGLGMLESVGGDLDISSNDALTSLDGIGMLTSVGGDLSVTGNDALTLLTGLGAFTSVGSDLVVQSNNRLSSCACGLAGLIASDAFAGVAGAVDISSNLPRGSCISPEVVLADDYVCPTDAVECSATAPLSFDADGSSTDGAIVTASDFSRLPTGSFMDAFGEFVGVRHERGADPKPTAPQDIDLARCSFVSIDLSPESISASVPGTGVVAADEVYTFATSGGNQPLPLNSLLDGPSVFLLVVTGATPPQPGDPIYTVHSRLVAGVAYDRDGTVLGSLRGGLPPAEDEAQRIAFEQALIAAAADARATGTGGMGGAVGLAVTAWPNPTTGQATVTFGLSEGGAARVAVYDALGREVAVVADGAFGPGRHEASLMTPLPSGVYVVRASTPAGVQTARLTVAR